MPEAPILRSFTQVLQAAEDGQLVTDLSDETRDLIEKLGQVEMNGGKAKGKITLELNVLLDRGLVEITGSYKVKTPALRRGRTLLHVTPEGNLSRTDPRQPELNLRDVSGDAKQIRTLTG